MQGAVPIWADVKDDMNIDPNSIRKLVTDRTKAIMTIHWGGYPCDMREIKDISVDYQVPIIEDAAHAFGSRYRHTNIGSCSYSDFTMFSFQAIKSLTSVDGGALFCNKGDDYKRGKLLRWYGIDRESPRTDFRCEEDILEWGYKYHMNDINASIGLVNLEEVDWVIDTARKNAAYYDEALKNIDGIRIVQSDPEKISSYWLYTILVENRAEFMYLLGSHGIGVSRVHERNDKHTCTKQFKRDLPNLEEVIKKHISIPVGWWVTEEDREYIISTIKKGW
jgi:dTDP-4-amino-4,6-dideoxygalactose transaminase